MVSEKSDPAFGPKVGVSVGADKTVGIDAADVFGGRLLSQLKIFQHGFDPGRTILVELDFQDKKARVGKDRVVFFIQLLHRRVGDTSQVHVEGQSEIIFHTYGAAQKRLAVVNDVDDGPQVSAQDMVKKAARVVGFVDQVGKIVGRGALKHFFDHPERGVGAIFQNRPLVLPLDLHEHPAVVVAFVVAAQTHFQPVRDAVHLGVVHFEPRRIEIDAAHGIAPARSPGREGVGLQKRHQRCTQRSVLFDGDEIFEFVAQGVSKGASKTR